ncbi:MAG: hypothetical protein WCO57_03635 [Verrucomicrobiota bacterium]
MTTLARLFVICVTLALWQLSAAALLAQQKGQSTAGRLDASNSDDQTLEVYFRLLAVTSKDLLAS